MDRRFCIHHLIMPNYVECCTKPVLNWISRNMPEVPINIMDQYYLDDLCDSISSKYREHYSEIARPPSAEEIIRKLQYLTYHLEVHPLDPNFPRLRPIMHHHTKS